MTRLDALTDRTGFDAWGFLLFSHGWTWLWWSVPIAAGWHVFRFPGVVFLLVGGIGVTLGGVAMTWLVEGRAGLRELGRRIVDPGRISLRWAIPVVALWPALALGSAVIARVVDGASRPLSAAPVVELLGDPLGLLATLAAIFLLGPFHEEIGWRGYWLDSLQRRWSALTASLVLGVGWAAWHGPLFLMVGYFSSWDFSPDPAWFVYNILVGSVLYTWLYNNTERSVLAAIAFHFVGNAVGQLLELSQSAQLYQSLLTTLLVVGVVLWWGPRDLKRSERRQ